MGNVDGVFANKREIEEAIKSIMDFYKRSKNNKLLSFHWALTGMMGEFCVAKEFLNNGLNLILKQKRFSCDLIVNNKRIEVKTTKKDETKQEIGFDRIKPSNFDYLVLVYLENNLELKKMKWFTSKEVKEMFIPRAVKWKNHKKIESEDLENNFWIAYKKNNSNEKLKYKINLFDVNRKKVKHDYLKKYLNLVCILEDNNSRVEINTNMFR